MTESFGSCRFCFAVVTLPCLEGIHFAYRDREGTHQLIGECLFYKLRKYKISAMTALSQVVILKCL
ncbi:hypothetical protein, partial [uncultured Virgibacillus sp.]|uniref:hypothetical protein n=1 Tax=uncultured Virgibacillus sp. TaxID=417355 RepID=UPI0026088CDA